ncbi:MAG: pilus assembly protein, partial [Clostridia bacterium]|nr:pilus assembly protein [Clostridia bacterium]
ELISLTSPVKAGENATITIQGKPNTKYYITVIYKSGPSDAEELNEKISDSNGVVSWTWKVGARTSAGTWKIVIKGGGQEKTFSFDVIK